MTAHTMTARSWSVPALCGALLLASSCSSSRDEFNQPPPQAPFSPPDCTNSCSSDARTVVDCRGTPLESCKPDAACYDGACMLGCDAAKAAQSTVGCDYYVAKPQARNAFFYNYDASCYAVLVANTWSSPVTLSVEYDGREISSSYFRIPRGSGKDIRYELLPEGKLPRDELAVLFLAMQPPIPDEINPTYSPCPESVGAAIIGQTEVRGSGIGKTFHVRASAPVAAYDIYPYGGAASYIPSSSLLLPTSAWGTENFAMDGWSADADAARQGSLPYFQILAQEDDTHIKVIPTAALSSAAGAPQRNKGELFELTLQRGEFIQYTQVEEINGTPIASDKPVSIVGGATSITVPNSMPATDTLHQQLPPIRLFGDVYVATRYRDREPAEPERTPWRILAAASGTVLTFEPPIEGAPTTLEKGQWAEVWAPGPFLVRSQDAKHPIYVASYMTAGANVSTEQGDPEFVNVVPLGQWLPSYIFLSDPTYGNTNLVFVRGPDDKGVYPDVQLDCVGAVNGWQRVGGSPYEVAYVDLVRSGLPQGSCDNGVHRASGTGPFSLTVWGWDRYASYGFPAGMGTRPLNDVGTDIH
jgi:IgGFc binding protein